MGVFFGIDKYILHAQKCLESAQNCLKSAPPPAPQLTRPPGIPGGWPVVGGRAHTHPHTHTHTGAAEIDISAPGRGPAGRAAGRSARAARRSDECRRRPRICGPEGVGKVHLRRKGGREGGREGEGEGEGGREGELGLRPPRSGGHTVTPHSLCLSLRLSLSLFFSLLARWVGASTCV